MDVTPRLNDSGYTTATSSCSRVKRTLHFPSCESTPSTSNVRSRKRKSEPCRKLTDILEDKHEVSPIFGTLDRSFYENSFNNSNTSFIRGNFQKSSPVDDLKLSSSLEKCTLDDFINESQHSAKKYKWDDEELSFNRKSSSAPGTPQRQEKDSDHSLRKYYSLDLTPTKGINVKIGTPERLEILYPKLVEVKSPTKIRRLTKPARKRLFQCRDFVYLFTKVKKVDHIIKQIFSYLSDTDLVNVAKVSESWKKSLETDHEAFKRYKSHLRNITISKENIYEFVSPRETSYGFVKKTSGNLQVPRVSRSPPRSPSRENWTKFTKMAAALSGTQRLTKCEVCGRPAVLERGLARCSGPTCGYLWCVRCLRGSCNVPEEVACICTGPHSPPLADRSNLDAVSTDTSSLYFLDHSSGYFSHSDGDKSLSFCDKPHRVLADCNDNMVHRRNLQLENNNNSVNVLEHSAVIQKAKKCLRAKKKTVEPGSPQKIKIYAAGSKQSKRNLRRL